MKRIKIFGREPAAWITGALAVLGLLVSGLALPLLLGALS